MSKDYAQIANDVVTGIGLLRQGAARYGEGLWLSLDCGNATKALDTKNKGTDGARGRYRGSL